MTARAAASTDAVDQVTGSLATAQEPHQGSVLTFVAMIGLSIIVSLWLWGRLKAVIAFVLCLTLAAIGAVAATRAAPLFVLLLGVALVGGALSLGKWRPPIPRVAAVGTASLAAAAAVFGLSIAFYSGLYSGISEKEQQGAVGARPNAGSNPVEPPVTSDAILVARKVPVADGKRPSVTVSWRGVTRPSVQDWIGLYHPGDKNAAYIDWIHNSSCSRTEGGKAKSFGSCSFVLSVGGTYEFRLFTDAATRLARSETVSVEQVPAADLLPGRIAQLKLAAQISVRDGLAIAVIGRGPGSSEPAKPYYRDTHSIPRPQRTGSTWFGKLLTETGWLGVAAFLALLAWLVLLGRRLCRSTEASEDRVLGIALIGVAALTGATAVYGTFPSLPGYAVLFWAMVGLAISAARDGRRRANVAAVTEGQHSVGIGPQQS
jgi:MFS family permease